jgi:nitrogen fixation-related uncharacterized protein
MSFLEIWVIYAIFGSSAFSILFFWAVRARQFSNLERGRHIPIESMEEAGVRPSERPVGRIDKYTWLVLVTLAAAVLISVVWIGVRSG